MLSGDNLTVAYPCRSWTLSSSESLSLVLNHTALTFYSLLSSEISMLTWLKHWRAHRQTTRQHTGH
jgi:hypothetical protein